MRYVCSNKRKVVHRIVFAISSLMRCEFVIRKQFLDTTNAILNRKYIDFINKKTFLKNSLQTIVYKLFYMFIKHKANYFL